MSDFFEDMVKLAEGYGIWGLLAVSFAESVFFPIPPDVLLIPMSLLDPSLALWFATLTTAGSVFGGVFGYLLGWSIGRPVLEKISSPEQTVKIYELMAKYGIWAVVIAGLTPVPYKLVTIASGISRISLVPFIIASFLSRGARFYLIGAVIMLLGEEGLAYIKEYMLIIFVVIIIASVFIWLIYKNVKSRYQIL